MFVHPSTLHNSMDYVPTMLERPAKWQTPKCWMGFRPDFVDLRNAHDKVHFVLIGNARQVGVH